jgi:integrase
MTTLRQRTSERTGKPLSELQFLTPTQANTLLLAVRNEDQEALYTLALTTGMRAGQLFALMWADVNLDTGELTVNRALAQTKRKKGEEGERVVLTNPKTFGSRRTIDIPKVAVEALRRHRLRQKDLQLAAGPAWKRQDFVFTSRGGNPARLLQYASPPPDHFRRAAASTNPLLRSASHTCLVAHFRGGSC